VRRLHLEVGGEEGLDDPPLVQPQAVDDDEHRRPVALDDGEQELAHHVDRQRGAVPLEVAQPGRVGGAHELGELPVHVRVEAAQRVVQPHLAGRDEIDVPLRQLAEALDPAAPVEWTLPLELDRPESLDEVAGDRLLTDAGTLENARDRRQYLARIDRLHQVVAHVGAERLPERRVVLALRDHHHRKVRGQVAHLSIRLESALAGHLFVEQHEVECLAPEKFDGVLGVVRPVDLVALLPQEDPVRLEQLGLIVHPEDGLHGRRRLLDHGGNIGTGDDRDWGLGTRD
jgi:hypothetical protein